MLESAVFWAMFAAGQAAGMGSRCPSDEPAEALVWEAARDGDDFQISKLYYELVTGWDGYQS